MEPDYPTELKNLKFPREMFIYSIENVIMYKGQLVVYQTMSRALKSLVFANQTRFPNPAKMQSNEVYILRGCEFEYYGQLRFEARS